MQQPHEFIRIISSLGMSSPSALAARIWVASWTDSNGETHQEAVVALSAEEAKAAYVSRIEDLYGEKDWGYYVGEAEIRPLDNVLYDAQGRGYRHALFDFDQEGETVAPVGACDHQWQWLNIRCKSEYCPKCHSVRPDSGQLKQPQHRMDD